MWPVTCSRVLVSRLDETGARLDTDLAVEFDAGGANGAGDARLTVTEDGATLVIHGFDESDVVMTPIGGDGAPGTPVMVGRTMQ